MNTKSFPEEVGPYCDFLLAHVSASVRRKTKHVVRKGRSAMAVDDALQCHALFPSQTLVGGHD